MKTFKLFWNKSIFLLLLILASLFACETNEEEVITEEYGIAHQELTSISAKSSNSSKTVDIWVYTNNRVPISTALFGVNNNWRTITNTDYPIFENKLESINYQGIRFPGGWESEFYDWNTDTTPGWSRTPASPGASISTILASNPPTLSIVVPSADAMNLPIWSTEWYAAIQVLKNKAVTAINAAGENNILSVEFGNEWWLQFGGGVSRASKLTKYSHIAKRVIKHIRLAFPNSNFKILVNGDFTVPSEFTTMNTIFGSDIQYADGVALHPYAGYDSSTHNILNVKSNIIACRDNFGKSYVHLSEWAPSKAYNNNKVYAQGANVMVELIHEFGRSGADAGAFWPPKNTSINGLGLFNFNYNTTYPTAQLFGDMVDNYTGDALSTATNGDLRAVASRDGDRVTVYVSGMDEPNTTVRLRVVGGSGNQTVVSSMEFIPGDTSNTAAALPMTLNNNSSVTSQSYGFNFDVNSQCEYSIQRLIFDLN